MSKYEISPLASDVISRLPALAGRLEKYDQETEAQTVRCEALEREIEFVKGRIARERDVQRELAVRLTAFHNGSAAGLQLNPDAKQFGYGAARDLEAFYAIYEDRNAGGGDYDHEGSH